MEHQVGGGMRVYRRWKELQLGASGSFINYTGVNHIDVKLYTGSIGYVEGTAVESINYVEGDIPESSS